MSDDLDPVERSDAFDEQLQGAPVVRTLLQIGQRNRRLIRVTLVSVAFDIALSGALAFGFVRANDAAQSASTAASAARVNCLSANQTHRDERKLWLYVLSFPGPPGETAAERAQRIKSTRQFKQFLNVTFRIRDCSTQALAREAAGVLSAPKVLPTATSVPTPADQVSPAPSGRSGPPTPHTAAPPTRHHHSSMPPSPSESRSSSPSPSPSPILTVCVPKPINQCVPPRPESVGYADRGGDWVRVIGVLLAAYVGIAWLSWAWDT